MPRVPEAGTCTGNGSWTGWPQDTPVKSTNGVQAEFYGSFRTSGKPAAALTSNVP